MNKYLIYFLITVVAYIILHNIFLSKTFKTYKNFGIKLPRGYTVHGIDVSRYQQQIDWKMVSKMKDGSASIDFAIIKATEGTNRSDPFFNKNWEGIKQTNLIRGAYLYFHPNTNAKEQAQNFINKVKLSVGDIAPVVDIEETNGAGKTTIQKNLKLCLTTLQEHYKLEPIIYANADFYNAYLKDSFDQYPFWVAHYEVAEPNVMRSWSIWQHNDKGTVNGINAAVDFNTLKGDITELHKLCKKY
jgi:lysozyme